MIVGWIVPKTEIPGRPACDPESAGPAARVPPASGTKPIASTAIPAEIERFPARTKTFPTRPYLPRLLR